MQPEIVKGDGFFEKIKECVLGYKPKNILEIGSGEGRGSTLAFVQAISENGHNFKDIPKLICLEGNRKRWTILQHNYLFLDYVEPLNVSSVPREAYLSDDIITNFIEKNKDFNIAKYGVEEVLKWKRQELEDLSGDVFEWQKFDMVLIDGSAFTGSAEMTRAYGSKIIMLDDIFDIKNYTNYNTLLNSVGYELIWENKRLRNGCAIFRRILDSVQRPSSSEA